MCGCVSVGDSGHSLCRLIGIYFEINCTCSNLCTFYISNLEIYLAVNMKDLFLFVCSRVTIVTKYLVLIRSKQFNRVVIITLTNLNLDSRS